MSRISLKLCRQQSSHETLLTPLTLSFRQGVRGLGDSKNKTSKGLKNSPNSQKLDGEQKLDRDGGEENKVPSRDLFWKETDALV